MKTLVNKQNPQIRITAPEIFKDRMFYIFKCKDGYGNKLSLSEDQWTLVEEKPLEGIKGNLEEIPSNVGLEKAAEEYADKHGFRVPYDGSNNFYDDVDVKASLEGFKAGAKWMAEQIKGGSK